MDSFYEDARKLAVDLGCFYDGMASVKVEWNPYEGCWFGQANWSCNSKINGNNAETPTDAILALIDRLKEELSQKRWNNLPTFLDAPAGSWDETDYA